MTVSPNFRNGHRFLVHKCTTLCVPIISIILLNCLSYSVGVNGSFLSNLFQGSARCDSGCLYPNMSVEHLLQGRYVSGNIPFKNESQLIPEWTNYTLFKVGQKFARDNVGFLGISHLYALIFDNFMPDTKGVLFATGTTSTPEGTAKRFTATAAQVVLWYQNSLEDPKQRRILLDSLHQVRRRHLDATLKVVGKLEDPNYLALYKKKFTLQMKKNKRSIYNDLRFWSAFHDDLKYSQIPPKKRMYPAYTYEGKPITQFNHIMTQFSFAGMAVLFRRQLGMLHVTKEELRGYVHFWGVIGHALGIQDEYNICMQANLEESTQLFRHLLEQIAIPALFQMDETSHIQISAYLDGLSIMDSVITPGLMGYRFLRDIAQVKPTRMLKQLNILERFYVAGWDGLMSDNLMFNKWLTNAGGVFFVDVNGYKYFGRNYTTDEKKSQNVYYTKEKVLI